MGALRLVLATSNPGKVREMRHMTASLGLSRPPNVGPGEGPSGEPSGGPIEQGDPSSESSWVEWVGLDELGIAIEMPEEDGATFFDNALLKARAVAEQTGLAAVADDSGLEVDALAGKPGVHSARFAGEAASTAANNALLLERLHGVPEAARGARFRCATVLAVPALTEVAARLRGRIGTGRSGDLAGVSSSMLQQEAALLPPLWPGGEPAGAATPVRAFAIGAEPLWGWGWLAEGQVEGRIAEKPSGNGGFGYDPLFYFPPLGRHFAELTLEEKNAISHRAMAFGQLIRWLGFCLRGAAS